MWLIKIIISKIPAEYFVKCFVNFGIGIKHNPILSLAVVIILIIQLVSIYNDKNSTLTDTAKRLEMQKEIDNALNHLGNGSTIAGISIGEEYYLDDKISFAFDTIHSCDKNFPGYIKTGKCAISVRWMNKAWQTVQEIDKRSLDALNSDEIKLGKFSIKFKDGIPLCLDMYNDDFSLSETGKLVKEYVPDLFLILARSKKTIEDICIVRIRHPMYHNIVYLITLSFWYNEYGRPEMNFQEDKIKILEKLAKIKKRHLM